MVRNAAKNRHGEVQMENAVVSELPFSGTVTPTINRQFLEKRSSSELDETSNAIS